MENLKSASFSRQQFLNLRTYRRNGEAVPTPVWFAQEGDLLYVRTSAKSGKVKRIRNHARVDVAPCDMAGNLRGDWVPAQAFLSDDEASKRVNRLFRRKYGLQFLMFEATQAASRFDWATIEIHLE